MAFIGAPPLDLRYLGFVEGRRAPLFELLQDLVWADPVLGRDVVVPAGTETDFASVPRIFWGLIASYGKQTLPAILHDQQARVADFRSRRDADDMFRRALVSQHVSRSRAAVMWAAVGIVTWVKTAPLLGALFMLQAIAGIATVVLAIVLAFTASPWFLFLLLAPAVLMPLWRREAWLLAATTYLIAWFSPVLLGAVVLSGLYFLLSLLAWGVDLFRGPPPSFFPTVGPAPAPTDDGGATTGSRVLPPPARTP